jgi:predicted CxxxxCH...CXXCH cytochrome family protein
MPQIKRLAGPLLIGLFLLAGCGSSTIDIFDPDTGHPSDWVETHGAASIDAPDGCTSCHGPDLEGGISGVGCFATSFNGTSCHGSAIFHGQGWDAADQHGASAKAAPGNSGFASCQTCHGDGFDGGIIRTPCFTCHGVDAPHPAAPWRGSKRTHTNTNVNNADVCALCHLGDSGVQVPPGTPPGCFNSTLCHAAAGAPHPVPFTAPTAHGPAAKANLVFCQDCHANPSDGGPGSNPRFNVTIGTLAFGCEDCHEINTAHPVPWLAPATSGHQTAGNMPSACALCHGVNLEGGTGPACSFCHTSGSPLTETGCTSCHGAPPTGSVTPNEEGAHTEHNALPAGTGSCGTCHSGAGTGTSNHFNGLTDVAFLPAYDAKSGPALHNANGTCSSVSCHGGQVTPSWLTGSIDVNTGCTSCHRSRNASDQYNSYFSGRHRDHISEEGIFCTECHDTAKLSAVHFTDLETTAMNEAGLTIIDAANYTGSTCTITCHGEDHNNESW